MSSLGEKLNAEQKLKSIIKSISSEHIDEATVQELNALFGVFGSSFVLERKDDRYELADAQALYEKCLSIVKREYSRVFMESMALTIMLQEDED